MDIVRISAVESIPLARPLLVEHWEEIARNKDLMVLAPDEDTYAALEKAGILFTLGAFDGDELVGYSATMVHQHLHYKALRYATNDVLFVSKRHRQGRLGVRLMRETELIAKERGAQLMLWHAKTDTPLEAILPRMGYAVQDVIFSKAL